MSYKVIIDIIANGQKAVTEFDKAGRAAERMAKKTTDEVEKTRISTEKLGRQAGIIGASMLGAAGTIAFAMRGWVSSAQEAERAQMQLESSVRGSYGATSKAVGVFEAQAKALQKVTVAADEDVMSIQALLVQFGLTQRQVTTLTPLVVDISRKWGIDYVSAAKAVAKAADGKATALKKLGINVDEAKAKTDPYIATVEALRRAAGGFAQEEGKTFAGQTAILKNQMDELKESLGRGVLSALNDVLPAVNGVAGAFTGLDDKTGGLVGRTTAVATGFLLVSGAALVAASSMIKIRAAYDEAAASSTRFAFAQKAIGTGFAALAGIIAGSAIVDAVAKWGDKVNDGVRNAINAKTAKEAFTEFERAATAQSSKEVGFFEFGKGIGAMVVQGVSFGSARLYENLDNKWKRAAFEKTFKKVFEQDPDAAGQILRYIDADDKRHAAFVRMGVDLDNYQKMVKDKLIDTNRDGVKSIEEKLAWDEKQVQAADTLIGVVNGQGAAARSFTQAQIDLTRAQQGVTDAQKAYTEAVKSGDPAKVKEAQLGLQAAMLTLAGAQDQAREAAFKHAQMLIALKNSAGDTEGYDNAIAKLKEMRDILTDPAEKKAIQDEIDNLVMLKVTAKQKIELNDAEMLTSLARLRESGKLTEDQLVAIQIRAGAKLDLNDSKIMASLWRLKAAGEITDKQLKELGLPKQVGPLDTTQAVDALRNIGTAAELSRRQLMAIQVLTQGFGRGVLSVETQLRLAQRIAMTGETPEQALAALRGRAAGGPVSANTAYMVGERGPELFVPSSSGTIIPNSSLGGGTALSGMGTVVNINVASSALSTPAETGAAVVDALTAWQRRNGRLPLQVA